ncbi:GCN5-related N-acetyltransferase [Kribbella flavida DSM 17836]|uniref:GCN5-related N-acetyltransferase n=1 Tax=Kribbella flavida (strain DSM 17836 / JCM 10339 / NBRC 14399) TaxID=479435 RepID=D2PYE9_KRIFD|nr:GNAT family protein [Kribbella flavida]ADB35517.1 GCN5-related N-acetyltransferase [Kribbella flavida DSM 17836]
MFAATIADNAELRPLEPWQAAEFQAHVDKARTNLSPYLPWAVTVVDDRTAREFLQRYAERQAADEGRIYGIWLADELVGGLLFRTFDTDDGSCEIGVWLAGHAEGRGLVTRSAQLLIDWALGVRGLSRVEWRCVPSNTRSIAVARRLGMTHEGTLRQAFPYRGEAHDVQTWSLLRTEWEDRSRE